MGDALSAGVTGLKAHQKMLDVAGNNLANINTAGFKSSRVTFSELLSETVQRASGPTTSVGGLNPQQLGSGVGIAGISRNMSQGSFETTGKDLDMAISGEGYFVVNSGTEDLYTRIGAFSVDADGVLVDAQSGFRVQRYGSIGEDSGFQTAGDDSIHIPYDVALPANATTTIQMVGNLRATSAEEDKVANTITSSTALSTTNGFASVNDNITSLDQFSGTFGAAESGSIRVQGTSPDGTTPVDFSFSINDSDTVQDILTGIQDAYADAGGGDVIATLKEGKIVVTDAEAGYSKTVLSSLTYTSSASGDDLLELPTLYKLTAAGAEDSHNFSIPVFDQLGTQHVMRGSYVKTDVDNTWDIVIMSVSGEVDDPGTTDRRIEGIQFNDNGSLKGMADAAEPKSVELRFETNPSFTQTISFDIGSDNSSDGLTQTGAVQGKTSTAAAKDQDGYGSGTLSSLTVSNEGRLVGTFSNGEKKDIAAIQLATFENPEGLEAAGNGYFVSTENSGQAISTMALNGGAGSIQGQKLEKSNVDTANEFVMLMQAQNGYQANSRTITVANDILRELTSLIR